MIILLIEDDEHKRQRVVNYLGSSVPTLTIETAQSVQGGIQMLQQCAPNLILLDMSLPVFDYKGGEHGFQHLPYGGKDVLEYLDSYAPNVPVIVLTAFDRFSNNTTELSLAELDDQLVAQFPDQYVGSIWYSALEDRWQAQLSHLIARAVSRNRPCDD